MKRKRQSNSIPTYLALGGLDCEMLRDIVNEAVAEIAKVGSISESCFVCKELYHDSSLIELEDSKVTEDLNEILGERSDTSTLRTCEDHCVLVCEKCSRDLHRKKIPLRAAANGFCFGEIPDVLQGLTIVEEQLVSRYRLKICVIRLAFRGKENAMLSQRALRGNVIAFPQNLSEIGVHLDKLPHIANVEETLKVVLVGCKKNANMKDRMRPWLSVRSNKVLEALRWKIAHDPLYSDVEIDMEAIRRLPLDDIPEVLWDDIIDEVEEGSNTRAGYADSIVELSSNVSQEMEVQDLLQSVGYVDQNGNNVQLSDVLCLKAKDLALHVPHEQYPTSEYEDSYWYGCFPVLFPYGRGGPYSQDRNRKISFKQWVDHCLRLEDDRFRKHSAFLFVAFNILRRHEYNQKARLRCQTGAFNRVSSLLLSISSEELTNLGKLLKSGAENVTERSTPIYTLMKELTMICGPIAGTAYSKIYRRNEIRSMILVSGLPTLWFTLNPSDVRNPLMALLCGRSVREAESMTTLERMRLIVENPVAAAMFFHKTVRVFLKKMVEGGMFGPCKNYYGVVETQGRGSLHIHMLIWVDLIPESSLYEELLSKYDTYREALKKYTDSVIRECVVQKPAGEIQANICSVLPNVLEGNWEEFNNIVNDVVLSSNMHSVSHNATCYKGKNTDCRFGFPRNLACETIVDQETLDIVPKRNNAWVNAYNPYVSYVFRCNHDIKVIASGRDIKALIYYLTEYTTKSELRTHEVYTLLGAAYKDMETTECFVSTEDRARRTLLRCLNKLGSAQEQSAQYVAAELLGYPCYYSSKIFKSLNWISYVRFVEGKDDFVTLEKNAEAQIVGRSLRVDYIHRGDELAGLSLYFYYAYIYDEVFNPKRNYSSTRTFYYDRNHPNFETHHQKLRSKGHEVIPTLIGPRFPSKRDDNELYAKAVLVLFKPWMSSSDLIENHSCWADAYEQFEEELAMNVGNLFPNDFDTPPASEILNNIALLTDCEIQAGIRRKTTQEQSTNDNGNSGVQSSSDSEDGFNEYPESLGQDDSLVLEPLRITNKLQNRSLRSFVLIGANDFVNSQYLGQLETIRSSGSAFCYVENPNWLDLLKKRQNIGEQVPNVLNMLNSNSAIFTSFDQFEMFQSVIKKFMLNIEQMTCLWLVFSQLVFESNKQLLCSVSGEAGTGKSQVIKAIVHLLDIMGFSKKLKVCASTGSAASKLSGQTIHSLLGLRVSILSKCSAKFKELLEDICQVRYIIIDEVSMISAEILCAISRRLQMLFCSEEPFGGLNMLFFGDFYQFPPVSGTSLYKQSFSSTLDTNGKVDAALGCHLWKQLNAAVVLRHNYRQRCDFRYISLLHNFLKGNLTDNDFNLLASRILKKNIPRGNMPIIVNRNLLRSKLNNLIISRITRNLHDHEIRLSVAEDTCRTRDINHFEIQSALLELPDNRTDGLPGQVLFYHGAEFLVTQNINPKLGIANGTLCKLYTVPDCNNFEHVLVEILGSSIINFDGLPTNVVPIYKASGTFSISEAGKKVNITRKQFPLVPSYVITDYKAQGATFRSCVVDLRRPPGISQGFHSLYVMLSRVVSLQGLFVLADFSKEDLKLIPSNDIIQEQDRLELLFSKTTETTRHNPNRLFEHCENICSTFERVSQQ